MSVEVRDGTRVDCHRRRTNVVTQSSVNDHVFQFSDSPGSSNSVRALKANPANKAACGVSDVDVGGVCDGETRMNERVYPSVLPRTRQVSCVRYLSPNRPQRAVEKVQLSLTNLQRASLQIGRQGQPVLGQHASSYMYPTRPDPKTETGKESCQKQAFSVGFLGSKLKKAAGRSDCLQRRPPSTAS